MIEDVFNPNGLTGVIMLVLQLVAIAAAVFALIHALRQRGDAFSAVDKLSKPIWMGILGVALLVLLIFGPIQILGIIAVVAVCVYLVDVRPRVDEIQRGPRW
jgi:cobalamin synthase